MARPRPKPRGMFQLTRRFDTCLNCQDPSSILTQLPQIDASKHSELRTAVFLATPAFGHWLDRSHSFLPKAMQHIYSSFLTAGSLGPGLVSVSAIVDKLPEQVWMGRSKGKRKPRKHRGFEGVALLVTSARPEYAATPASEERTQDTATITFASRLCRRRCEGGTVWRQKNASLPVANTLFVNGRRTTLVQDHWAFGRAKGITELVQTSRHELKDFRIAWPKWEHEFARFHVPLEALTKPRKVVASMGNIIRTVYSEEQEKPIPASAELEKIVPDFLRRVTETAPDGVLQIYALVQPPASIETSETIGPRKTDDDAGIAHAIWAGAALHRVTSGGGGWGSKAGLLSLDTAYDFEPQPESFGLMPMLDDDIAETGDERPGHLVPEGSTVTFFASYHSTDPQSDKERDSEFYATATDVSEWTSDDWFTLRTQKLRFGNIPTSEYHEPRSSQSKSPLLCFPDTFGMLSEGGLSIGADHELSKHGNEHMTEFELKPVVRSRLDVPFTLVNSKCPSASTVVPSGEGKGKSPTHDRGGATQSSQETEREHEPSGSWPDQGAGGHKVTQYLDLGALPGTDHTISTTEKLKGQRRQIGESQSRQAARALAEVEDSTHAPLVRDDEQPEPPIRKMIIRKIIPSTPSIRKLKYRQNSQAT